MSIGLAPDAANSGAYSQAPRTLSVHLRAPREPSSELGKKDHRLHSSRACDFKRIFARIFSHAFSQHAFFHLTVARLQVQAAGPWAWANELALLVTRVRPLHAERRHTIAIVPRCGRTTILFAARRSAFNVRL